MQQSLNFYDAILSHDHPAYLGVLRLSLTSAKAGTDKALVKIYIVTLTFLPINILTGTSILSPSLAHTHLPHPAGLFSGNTLVPHNGTRAEHLLPDGSVAGYSAFGALVGGVVTVALCMWTVIYLIIVSSRRQFRKKGLPTNK